jgi:RNA polymerase sigma-70 factor (ECF subfamily)
MQAEETTALLLDRARGGDDAARERLAARYLPMLRRWAHGRLPASTRDLTDTDDLVQVTLFRVLKQIGRFEYGGAGSFLAYLRSTLLNLLRNEIRRVARRGESLELDENLAEDDASSPLEQAIGRERLERYEAALEALPARARELVIMRLEFDMTYEDIANEVQSTPDAVRMAIRRAVEALARSLGGGV